MFSIFSKTTGILFLSTCFILSGYAETYYISPQGNDSFSGSFDFPFQSIEKGIEVSTEGDTIFVRGGTYTLTATIRIDKDGSEGNCYNLMSYPGEQVFLDFSAQALGGSNRGILLAGSYWNIEGLNIFGAGDNGLKIDNGNYNRIVNCSFYRNRDSGLQMGNGASYNQVINCDSYYNADPTDYGDADGFAAKLDVGVENYFYGCRAWLNCDDGWDGYLRGTDNASTIIENCWAFENGYLEDGTDPGPNANGNGFKMGGSDDKTLSHHFILRNCLAFNNKAKGFDQNSNMGSMILYNCSGYNNLAGNYKIYKTLAEGNELVIKNSLVLGEVGDIAEFAIQETNSWMPPFSVSEEDFLSVDEMSAYGLRNPDGTLPSISYMHLAEGSDLINAGVDVGLPFNGSAPDLGCFESTYNVSSRTAGRIHSSGESHCYPNPASEILNIIFSSKSKGDYSVTLFDLEGRTILQTDPAALSAPTMDVEISLPDLEAGIYFYSITIGDQIFDTGKFFVK